MNTEPKLITKGRITAETNWSYEIYERHARLPRYVAFQYCNEEPHEEIEYYTLDAAVAEQKSWLQHCWDEEMRLAVGEY